MRKIIIYTILIVIGILLFAIEKSFYGYSGDFDRVRIPLVKPYELFSSSRGKNWLYPTENIGIDPSFTVDSIGVCKNYVAMYTYKHHFRSGKSDAWLVIDCKSGKEELFEHENIYTEHLLSNYGFEVGLFDITDVYKEFSLTLRLPTSWPFHTYTDFPYFDVDNTVDTSYNFWH